MRSAFGIEHGEVSKGLKVPHRAAMGKFPTKSAKPKARYAEHRLAARYASFGRKVPGSKFKELGRANKELSRQDVAEHAASGTKRKLP